MKPLLTKITLLAALLLTSALSAQITIDGSNLIEIGDTTSYAIDTAANIIGGPAGGNQVWDFSSLSVDDEYQNFVLDPASTPLGSNFPGANLAVKEDDGDSTWVYLRKNTSEIASLGFGDILGGNTFVDPFEFRMLSFPSTNNTSYDVYYSTGMGFSDTSSLFPQYDSIGVTSGFRVISEIDAWGKLQTPLGTWDALRQNVTLVEIDSLVVFSGGAWSLAPFTVALAFGQNPVEYDSTFYLRWWSDDDNAPLPLIIYDYDSSDPDLAPEDGFVEWLQNIPSNSVSTIELSNASKMNIFPNPGNSLVTFSHPQMTKGQLLVFDAVGKLKVNHSVAGPQTYLSVEELPVGLYHTVLLNDKGERVSTQKLSVTH